VRARIIADGVKKIERVGSFTFVQRTAILSGAAAVIVLAVFGSLMIARKPAGANMVRSVSEQPKATRNNITAIQQTEDPVTPADTIDGPPPEARMPHVERAIEYKTMPERRDLRRQTQPEPQLRDTPGEFYALADLHPSEEATRNGRIVRVELSRASLVALGVNIPLDSETQFVKTDLLIGPDGVPRAIRLVE
jgi:hypothetical protein